MSVLDESFKIELILLGCGEKIEKDVAEKIFDQFIEVVESHGVLCAGGLTPFEEESNSDN